MPFTFPSRGFATTRSRVSGLLFAFGVDDLSTTLPSGQTLTFTRASGRSVLDTQGRVVTLAHSQFPWSAQYNTTESLYEPVAEFMADSANYLLRSEDFGTTWAAVSTPTRTAGAKTCGMLSLDLLNDTGGAALQGYTQTLTPSGGNGVKGVSLFVAQGTSTSSVVRVRDTTAGADRLLQTITWASGAPVVTATTGTYLGSVRCAGGVYRLLFQTTTWTVANTNQVEVYPATTSALATANTGSLYVGGVQVDKHIYPRGYVKTLGSTVVESDDLATTTQAWGPQDFTVYARFGRPAWAGSAIPSGTTQVYLCNLGGGAQAGYQLYYNLNGQVMTAALTDGTTSRSATAALPAGAVIEVCAKFQNVTTGGTVSLDVGSGYGSASTATGAISAWGSSTFQLGNAGTLTQADCGIRRLLIASGARTMAQMRGLAV